MSLKCSAIKLSDANTKAKLVTKDVNNLKSANDQSTKNKYE